IKKKIVERDGARDLNAELIRAARELKRGQVGRILNVQSDRRAVESPVAKVRFSTGLSQGEFARLLGVSVRWLQQWEEGRRKASGAALTLLCIAERYPKVLKELVT
ncbi:MAG: helix-turn-helix domain-containing protein, partial [Nitrososphaera sp.]|nr:helix-turn-helix domain-containing protein [Nitrososphaera sp.]